MRQTATPWYDEQMPATAAASAATMNMTTMTAKSLSLYKLDEGCRKRANPLNSPILNKFCKRVRVSFSPLNVERTIISTHWMEVSLLVLPKDLRYPPQCVCATFFCFITIRTPQFSMIIISQTQKVFHLTHFIYNLIIKIVLKIYYFISHIWCHFFGFCFSASRWFSIGTTKYTSRTWWSCDYGMRTTTWYTRTGKVSPRFLFPIELLLFLSFSLAISFCLDNGICNLFWMALFTMWKLRVIKTMR